MSTPTQEKHRRPAAGGGTRPPPTRPARRVPFGALIGLVVLEMVVAALALGLFRYTRTEPPLRPSILLAGSAAAPPASSPMPWPQRGQAVLYVEGAGSIAKDGPLTPLPMASTAKIMTALIVLERHPLAPGEAGPLLTLTEDDVDRYGEAIAADHSAVEVRAGERITQLELLQGLLVPSANNFADILARWDAGSVPAFVDAMNARARALGMTATHFDDASGFSPRTVSTAPDLLILARAAMADPVFAAIVASPEVTLPVAGPLASTNRLLGDAGVIGIKTGNTDEAGGCLVFAFSAGDGAERRRAFGVVLGQRDLAEAFARARELIAATPTNLVTVRAAGKSDVVATLSAPWGGAYPVAPSEDAEMLVWAGAALDASVQLDALDAPVRQGDPVGDLTLTVGQERRVIPLVTKERIPGPGPVWRLLRN